MRNLALRSMNFKSSKDELAIAKTLKWLIYDFGQHHRDWHEEELTIVLRMLLHMSYLRWAASQKFEAR